MSGKFYHIGLKHWLRPVLLLLFLLGTCSAWCQSEEVEEVVLDSVSFKNGDTTVPDKSLTEEESYDESEYNTDSSSEEIIYRSVPDSVSSRLKKTEEFEYANDPRYWVKEERRESSFNWNSLGFGVQLFMYGLLAFAICFIVYKLVTNNNLFYSKSKKITPAGTVDDLDISDENIDQKITEAINLGNLRLATRLLYIKSLKLLDSRGLIRFHPQATNYDYLKQVRQHRISGDFGWVTKIYEYVWYGEFTLSEQQFQIVKNRFETIFKEAR